MSKGRVKQSKPRKRTTKKTGRKGSKRRPRLWQQYCEARELALSNRMHEAREAYQGLVRRVYSAGLRSLIQNDLGVLDAVLGDVIQAETRFQAALEADDACSPAHRNLSVLEVNSPGTRGPLGNCRATEDDSISSGGCDQTCKVAILSFLFNWPSTGGGIVHTVELGQFLRHAGFSVQHIIARYAPWEIGRVDESIETPLSILEFSDQTWNRASIQCRFREAVETFDPDWVIITDSWNFKPLLAQAVRGYPYILRQQALECLCPLNNLRLLVEEGGMVRQCPRHQLAMSKDCRRCVEQRGSESGRLHQVERALSGFGTDEYRETLRTALKEAEAVFVLNPLVEAILAPYCRDVRVVTWGMDAARFPWPWNEEPERLSEKTVLVMAGVVHETIKGFHVLQEAGAKLWQKRQDFEIVATGEPAGRVNEFTRYVGWLSQAELPRYLRAADIVVMPTIAQEGLGRTTVEAMACGRPVIASRIGGLPYTVQDGATGLLCEAGNLDDLAAKIERLLDNPAERVRMGQLGRKQFEERFTWETVIERDYRPVLTRRKRAEAVAVVC